MGFLPGLDASSGRAGRTAHGSSASGPRSRGRGGLPVTAPRRSAVCSASWAAVITPAASFCASVVRLRDSDPSALRGRCRGVTPHSGQWRAWPPWRLICRSRARLPGHMRASCQPIPAARTTASSRAPCPAACSARRRLTLRAQCWTCRQFVPALDVPGLALPQVRRHGSGDGASLANSRNSVRNPLQYPGIVSLLRDSRSRGDAWCWRWSGSAAPDPTPDLARSVCPRR